MNEMNKDGIIFQNEADWLTERRKGLGGSDVAAIMGVSPYSTPTDVWLEKTGRVNITLDKQALEWGKRLEPIVANYYRERHPDYIVTNPGDYTIFTHPDYEFLKVTPDRFLQRRDEEWGLEIKTAGLFKQREWGKDRSDKIPEYYLPQVMYYMAVMGVVKWDVAVLIGGQEYREYTIDRDEKYIQNMLDKCVAWWRDHVETDIMPNPDGGSYLDHYLLNSYSNAEDDYIDSDDEIDAKVKRLAELKFEINQKKAEVNVIEQEMKNRIQNAKGIKGNDYKITWVRYDENRTDWKGIIKTLTIEDKKREELIEQYTKTSRKNRLNTVGKLFK